MKTSKTMDLIDEQGGTGHLEALLQLLSDAGCPRWQLQDAKSKFSELVQRAVDGKPQCVSRHGKDAVVIFSYNALMEAVKPKQNLFKFFRMSPLAGLDVEFERMQGDFRETDL